MLQPLQHKPPLDLKTKSIFPVEPNVPDAQWD
jgi:hypothetical protein